MAYVTSKYREDKILKGSIEGPMIWSQDLTPLPEDSYWLFSRDAAGVYHLTRSADV